MRAVLIMVIINGLTAPGFIRVVKAVNTVDFIRPEHVIRGDIPGPMTNPPQALRLFQKRRAFTQSSFDRFARGNIAMHQQADDPAFDLERRRHRFHPAQRAGLRPYLDIATDRNH